jgi:hypothetical protein
MLLPGDFDNLFCDQRSFPGCIATHLGSQVQGIDRTRGGVALRRGTCLAHTGALRYFDEQVV